MRNAFNSTSNDASSYDSALNYDPGHDPTLNDDSCQDSRDNFPKQRQIINNISQFREDLQIWRMFPLLRNVKRDFY